MDTSSLNPDADFDLDLDRNLSIQMGFTSFAVQPFSKRRRYNPSTDAVISMSDPGGTGELAMEQRYGEAGLRKDDAVVGSGGNGVLLGSKRKKVKERDVGIRLNGSDEKERVLGMERNGVEEDRKGGESSEMEDMVENKDEEYNLADGDGDGDSGGAEFLNSGEDKRNYQEPLIISPQPSQLHHEKHKHRQTYQQQTQEHDWWVLRRGVRNEKGDMVYYDNTFVEDPWVGLNVEGE